MSQPEAEIWYTAPLTELAEGPELTHDLIQQGRLESHEDGSVSFSASLRYDHMIVDADMVTRASRHHWDVFKEVRRRLGLAYYDDSTSKTDLGSFSYISPNYFGVSFSKEKLTDAEAMFLLTLPLASKERPLEKVLEEVRECAQLSLTQAVEVEPEPEIVPPLLKDFRKYLRSERITFEQLPYITQRLFEVPTVEQFVSAFMQYRNLMSAIPDAPNKRELITQLSATEKQLAELYIRLNPSLMLRSNLAIFRMHLGWTVSDIKDPEHVRGYHLRICHNIFELTPAQRRKLQLILVPASYEYEKARARQKNSVGN